jgi:cbb3-type cytochrome oxidase maturation protein
MSVILVLIAFSVFVAIGFLIAFIWSVRNGQYEDPYGASVRILFEDDKPREPVSTSEPINKPVTEQPSNQK